MMTGCLSSLFDGSRTFDDDVRLLLRRADAQVLRSPQSDACVVATAAYQGRVMTSAFVPDEPGHGWINHSLVRSGLEPAKEHPWGGEDRLSLGPEGGPFALFFGPGEPLDRAHRRVPALLDAEPFTVLRKSDRDVVFRRDAEVPNRAGTVFRLRIERKVGILGDSAELNQALQSVVPVHVRSVGYRTENALLNRGTTAWTAESGLLSLGSRGCLRATSTLRIIVPIARGTEAELGPVIIGDDFGMIAAGRLRVADGFVVSRGDGRAGDRFGVGSRRALAVLGAWDSEQEVLTIVRFSRPASPHGFLSTRWEESAPLADGAVIEIKNGEDFCELATSSPALALAPGASAVHRQTTVHLTGPRRELDVIARNVLGVGFDEIEAALP